MLKLIWDFMSYPIPIGNGYYFKLQYIFYIGVLLYLLKFYLNLVKK